ncbi:transporter substrate-binding domain-containing protein [Streptococcus sp. zg-JUN1979]|uniref:transporter substrate-binding domain-containing protein n=1 Tax=Streptococcus sp. zg-JUN1979 TaxID=3391450 RepID=UPI0039A6E2E0
MKWKQLIGGSLLAVSLLALGACGTSSNSSSSDSLKSIQDKGTLTVALNPEFAPFEFKTLVNGKDTVVGADVDIANAVGEALGVKVKFLSMSFDNVLSSLQSGKADIAVSGISATKERQKAYDFSDSYYESQNVVIVRKDELDKYKQADDFKGLQVAVQKGSIQESIAQEQLKGAKVVALTQNSEVISELKNKKIDAVVLEKPIAKGYVEKNSDLAIAESVTLTSGESDAYAIAMPKGSTELKDKINQVIKELKDSGKIDEFVQSAYEQSIND